MRGHTAHQLRGTPCALFNTMGSILKWPYCRTQQSVFGRNARAGTASRSECVGTERDLRTLPFEEFQMRFLGRLFPSFGRLFPSFGGYRYTSPYFYTPPKKRWWPFLTGCALGGVVVLLIVGRSEQPADDNDYRPSRARQPSALQNSRTSSVFLTAAPNHRPPRPRASRRRTS